ncbi:MAG: hypothetical protein IJU77_02965 [Butyrivibrio sp.]|nr:hypothetical protein [Butyrivibrio sp.]
MSVGINANLIYASIRDRNQKQADQWANSVRAGSHAPQSSNGASDTKAKKSGTTVRALESQQRTQDKANNSVVNQSMSYADALKASRTKAKEAGTEKKRLQYSYKKISSQIVRSKTSLSARKAASAARREVQRLKRLRSSGEYDEEELQISIEHAKSMERIAKKKVAHLQQEEMIERGQSGALSSLEEKEEEIQEEKPEEEFEELSEEEMADLEELDSDVYYPEEFASELQAAISDYQEEMQYRMEELNAEIQQQISDIHASTSESLDAMNSDMMSLLSDTLEDMAEELDLSELANTIAAPDPNMSEDDLKMLKLKHRTKEMKDIAKADGEYLKAIMDKYEKKGVAGMGLGSSGAATGASALGPSGPISSSPAPINITVPASYGGDAGSVSFSAFA